jgi:hypothetical protein
MKRIILVLFLTLACALTVLAQTQSTNATATGSTAASASASRADKSVNIESGTHLAAQLQNTLDARKARVGDQVILKTTDSIKSGGHEVVKKGARLIGHVTSVEQNTKATGASQVGLLFDRLDSGSLTMPITATISSITQVRTQTQTSDDDGFGSQSTSMSRSGASTQRALASSGGQGGGLLGGVTNTVGGATNGAVSGVGSPVSSTTGAVGQTTSGLGQSLGRIQISESSSTSVEGGSVLTLRGDNLHLEKGTTFNVLVSQSASASAGKNQ